MSHGKISYAEFLQRTSLSRRDLLALAWGQLIEDPPPELVRLPAPPMLMLDEVPAVERSGARGRIVGVQEVDLAAWFFQCHFSGDPVQPGCLGVDAVWQLVGLYCGLCGAVGAGRALGCGKVEFFGQIRPYNRRVRYEVEIRRFSRLPASGAAIAIADAGVLVDDELVYRIAAAKVGTFTGIGYPDYPVPSQNARGGVLERGRS